VTAMPFTTPFVVGGVLIVITLLFVVLLVLPGRGRGWRIGLLGLLLTLGGASLFLANLDGRRAASVRRVQGLELARMRALMAANEGRHSREIVLLHENAALRRPTLEDISLPPDFFEPPSASEPPYPREAPCTESCSDTVTGVAVPRACEQPRRHHRGIGGVGEVLGILGALLAATVVLKIATRHNARPRQP